MNHPPSGRYIPGVAYLELWRYEARRCGAAALSLPLLAAALVAAASLTARSVGAADSETIGFGIVRLITTLLPVAAGLGIAAALGRERAIELQLSVPTPYRTTVLRRIAAVAAVVVLASAVAIIEAALLGYWSHPATGVLALIVPLGPALMLVGMGAWSQVMLQSTAGASAVVLGAWLFQLLILDRFIVVWQINRALLAIAGGLLVVLALRRLDDTEHLLRGGTE